MKDEITRIPPPPQADLRDTAHAIGRGLISAIPVIGGVFLESVTPVWQPPLEKRLDQWREREREALNYLLDQGLTMEKLRDNEDFATLALDAMRAAMQTSSRSKHEALRNAIINGATSKPDEVKREMFLQLILDLTEVHVGVLKLLSDPDGWFKERGGTLPVHRGATGAAFDPTTSEARLEAVLSLAMPDYKSMFALVIDALRQRGLLEEPPRDPIHLQRLTLKAGACHVSAFALEFLSFIATPQPTSFS